MIGTKSGSNENIDYCEYLEKLISLLVGSLGSSLGIGLCSVLLYNFGKILGEELYNSYQTLDNESLDLANDYLINCLKTHNVVKDALIFKTFNPNGQLELVCRISGNDIEGVCENYPDLKTSLIYFFYRGILSRYYELYFKAPLNIVRISISSSEDMICEFILQTPVEDRGDEP